MNIDELVTIAGQTFCSIKGSWGIVFALWIHSGWVMTWNHPPFSVIFAGIWAIVVSIIQILLTLNRRLVSGPQLELGSTDDKYVVITGGCHGLGLILAAMFTANRIKVAVIDIEPRMEINLSCCKLYRADVSSREEVFKASLEIMKDHQGEGPFSVINCAGIAGGGQSLSEQSPVQIERILRTNINGNIWTIQAFSAAMKKRGKGGGHFVGISSATALVSPGGAAVYAASKAAVRAIYQSLRHEQSASTIRSLCVILGQMDTRMFSTVKTPDAFWAPILPTHSVATAIYEAVMQGRQGELSLPVYVKLLPFILTLLPESLVDLLRSWNGLDRAMDNFETRQ